MAVVFDLDLDDDAPSPHASHAPDLPFVKPLHHSLTLPTPAAAEDSSRPNPNVNGFSAALSCYP